MPASQPATPGERGALRARRGSSRGRGRGSQNQHTSSAFSTPARDGRATANPFSVPVTRGRGSMSQRFDSPRTAQDQLHTTPRGRGRARGRAVSVMAQSNSRSPFQPPAMTPSSQMSEDEVVHDLDMATVKARRDQLRKTMETNRRRYIEQGLMADPDKPTTLDHAITPVGTCTEMCPENERVDRMYEMQFELAESAPSSTSGRRVPVESKMVKKFRRAAAGVEEQLPSELRTSETLKRTLDYLIDRIVGGGDRLAVHHKFVWDRTRAIRNDFSIQQVTSPEDVRTAVDCFERIARFHILSLHQLSNPDNLDPDDFFDAQQEREQLSKTLQSLEYYYNDHRGTVDFPNESEFKAYGALFELLSQTPDLEDRISHWPAEFQSDPRTQTMIKIYDAAGDAEFEQGPLRPPTPCSLAQSNTARFWALLASKRVSYLMACVAEINFATIRFVALQHLWRSGKNAAPTQQKLFKGLTIDTVTEHLGFDTNEQTRDFCQSFGVNFATASGQAEYLDFTSQPSKDLDKSIVFKTKQVFSGTVVEKKRYHRTLPAVINGISVADAIEQGLIEGNEADQHELESSVVQDDSQSMFVPEVEDDSPPEPAQISSNPFARPPLNPTAALFTPKSSTSTAPETSPPQGPAWLTNFGSKDKELPASSIFAPQKQEATSSTPLAVAGLGSPQPSLLSSFPANTHTSASFNFESTTTTAPELANKPVFSFLNQQPSVPVAAQFTNNKPLFQPFAAASGLSTPAFAFGSAADPVEQGVTSVQQSPAHTYLPSNTSFAQSQTPRSPDSEAAQVSSGTEPTSTLSAFKLNHNAWPQPLPSAHTPEQSLHQSSSETGSIPQSEATSTQASSAAPTAPAFLFQSKTKEESTTPQTSPTKSQSPSSKNLSSDFATVASPQPPGNTAAVLHQPLTHTATKPSKTELTRQMVRIAMSQDGGIMDMYVQHTLAHILEETFAKFEQDTLTGRLNQLKNSIVARKFVGLWRLATERKRLQKRADRRRKMLAANVKAATELKRRKEEELEDVLHARRINRQVQEEQETGGVEKDRGEEREVDTPEQAAAQEPMPPPAQIAGRKRKILTNSTLSRSVHTTPVTHHKRSKTLSSSLISKIAHQTPMSTPGSASLRRALSQNQLRRSLGSEKKLDNTTTDYFKLKALGIEVGEENKFAERQKKRDEELQQMRVSLSARSTPEPQALMSQRQIPASSPIAKPVPGASLSYVEAARSTSTTDTVDVDDPLLAQLRQARLELASNTDWLHTENAKLGQEVKQEEDLRRSLSSAGSCSPSFAVSTNGFARSIGGFEYLPPSTQPGQRLSRTEERIKRTGARGLATKPIRPRKLVDEYAPVPMSRKTAREITFAHKRSRSETDELESPEPTSRVSSGLLQNGLTTSKRARQDDRTPSSRLAALSASYDEAEGEEEDDEEDVEANDESDEQDDLNDNLDTYEDEAGKDLNNMANGSEYINGYAGEEEELVQSDEEYDEDEPVEEDEDEESGHGVNGNYSSVGSKHPAYQREQSTQSGSQAVSTPQSGPGATEDDPFELSD